MEQYPVPQEVSSYQFKLVGDMTLKQFFQIAGGALIAIIIYASNLHPLIKWSLMMLSGLIGVALAFLPFQERPLEKWIFAFFRSIYSPTLFSWNKNSAGKAFFQEAAAAPSLNVIAPRGQETLENYLSSPSIASVFPPSVRPKIVVEEQPAQGQGVPAEFSLSAAPPSPPTTPNTVTGQVFDSSGGIIEGAILEVRDEFGRPVRALKTNKLGHFLIVTPLLDGKYEIITEKEGFVFDPILFETNGSIIPSIAIKAKPLKAPLLKAKGVVS